VSSPEAQALLDEILKRSLAKANPGQRKLLLRIHFLMDMQEKALQEKDHDEVIKIAGEVNKLLGKLIGTAEEK